MYFWLRSLVLALLAPLFCCTAIGQPVDTLRVKAFLETARTHQQGHQFREALSTLAQANAMYAQAKPDLIFIESLNFTGANYYYLGRYDSADYYWARAYATVTEGWPERQAAAARFLNNRYLVARRKGDLEQARTFAEEALRLKLTQFAPDDPRLFSNYNNLGSLYRNMGLYERAEQSYYQALALTDSSGQIPSSKAAACMSNLGILKGEQWDYEKALELQRKALFMRLATLDSLHPEVANSYDAIGNGYEKVGDYAKAREYHEKALRIREQVYSEGHDEVGKSHFNIGLDALRMGLYDEALYHNEQALAIFKQVYGEEHPLIARVLDQLGSLYDLERNFTQSIAYYEAALAMTQRLFGPDHHEVARIFLNICTTYSDADLREKAIAAGQKAIELDSKTMGTRSLTVAWEWGNLGEVHTHFGEYAEALNAYQEALVRMDTTMRLEDIGQNPQGTPLGFGNELFRILSGKGNTLLRMASQQEDSILYLDAALAAFRRGAGLVDTLRLHYGRPDSRHTLAGEARIIYNGGIRTAWRLVQATGQQQYLEDVFFFAERGRSMELMQTLHENQALQYAGLPPQLLDSVRYLSMQIAAREKQVYEAEAEGEAVPPALVDQIFAFHLQYDVLIEQLEANYPAYYELKYGQDLPALGYIQQQLPPECAMLNFMQAGGRTYGLRLQAGDQTMLDLGATPEIDSLVQAWRDLIPRPFRENRADQDWSATQLHTLEIGHALFQKLLQPFVEQGPGLPERLIIIPQGILSLVPFDALPTAPPRAGQSLREIPYLLRQYEVAMAYSAGNWLAVKDQDIQRAQAQWVGFAPSFGEAAGTTTMPALTRGDFLQPLAHNQQEVSAIQAHMRGTVFLGAMASEESFKDHAGDYAILHISSHAFVDPLNALYSGIAFAPDSQGGDDGFLELVELFTLQLPAEMAVLSACETNLGAYIRGEGIMSLARGFAYAGVGSVVATLWQVNDAATATIMELFYGQLKEGTRKSAALRAAKLAYLEQADNLSAHPYFWSGFVPIGNMEPLRSTKPNYWLFAVGFCCGVFGIGWIFWRRRLNAIRYSASRGR